MERELEKHPQKDGIKTEYRCGFTCVGSWATRIEKWEEFKDSSIGKYILSCESEINRLKEEYEQKRKTEHDYLKAANEDLKKEINRLKEEFIPPSDVEILLYSSSNEVYVNDDQRIGFQKGAKWMRKQLSQNKH